MRGNETHPVVDDPVERLRLYLTTGSDISDPINRELVARSEAGTEQHRQVRAFIADQGQVYQPNPRTDLVPARQGTCFPTAQELAASDSRYTYVEGFGLVSEPFLGAAPLGFAIHHAWCLDENGEVYDRFFRENGAAYIGVAFRREYLLERMKHFEAIRRGSPLLDEESFEFDGTRWRLQS